MNMRQKAICYRCLAKFVSKAQAVLEREAQIRVSTYITILDDGPHTRKHEIKNAGESDKET